MYLFAVIETIVILLFVWLMPKRLSNVEIYITWAIMAGLTLYIDFLLVLVFKVYYQGTPKVDWQVLMFEPILGPGFGVIFLNFMPIRRNTFICYLVGLVIPLSLLNELIAVHCGYITFQGWSIGYSAIVYFVGMFFLRWHLNFIRSR